MDVTWLILTLIALAFSALFSGIEIAFVTSDRVRVELDIQKGGLIGRCLNLFYSNPDFFISTILVGNNIVLVIYGIGAAKMIEPSLEHFFFGMAGQQAWVLITQTLLSTLVILLTGEFLPKSIFRINPNRSLRLVAPFTALLYCLLYPISLFSTWISRLLMKLCGMKEESTKLGIISLGDLNEYIEQTIDEQADEHAEVENEVKIFHNALDFSTIHLRDCMVPRNEIVAVDIDTTTREELSALFTSSGRSKILVYQEDIDNVLGYIHVSELFTPDRDWKKQLKDVIFAPETLLANKMMRRLEDLMEEICGDIQDEHDSTDIIERQISPDIWEFSGRAEIAHINETFHLDIPESDEYQTLAGYILNATGQIPSVGEIIELYPLRMEVLQKSASRLELIRLSRIPEPSSATS